MRFLAFALLVIATTYAEKVCEPGDSQPNGSNVCFCLGDGSGWVCAPGNLKEITRVKKNEDTCEPGKKFKSYCNSCFCGLDGKVDHSICTMMDCDHSIWNKDGSIKLPNEIAKNPLLRQTREIKENQDTCEPGKPFNYYCNSCFCGRDGKVGHSACTMMDCDHSIWNKDGSIKLPNEIAKNPLLRQTREIKENQDTCEPGKPFNYYCNSCFCGRDGKVGHSACTMMDCDHNIWNKDGSIKLPNQIANNPLLRQAREIKDNQDTCEPGKPFKFFCNSCFCGSDGKVGHSACTTMACDHNIWNKDGSIKLLNQIANNPLLRESYEIEENQDTCEPGKPFKFFCNSCFCGSDGKVGHSACTTMACDHNIWNKDGSIKLPNQIAKNPLLRQTREIKENQDTCEPGKPFNYYCNSCFCGRDGKVGHSACTTMACDHNIWNKDGSIKLPNEIANNPLLRQAREIKDSQDTCEPGKPFKYYCNSCFCGRDGKVGHSACTTMACDHNIWNKDGSIKLPNQIANNPLLRESYEIDENQDTCEPGKPFKFFCNSCFCGSDGKVGHSACTTLACDHNIWNKDGSIKLPNEIANKPVLRKQRSSEFLCQPGKLYKDDCNMCSCGKDGKSSACTFMLCPPRKNGLVPAPQVCEPRKYFKIDCNQCVCSEDGLKIACTQMACPDPAK